METKETRYQIKGVDTSEGFEIHGDFKSRAELYPFAKFLYNHYKKFNVCLVFNGQNVYNGQLNIDTLNMIEGVVQEEDIAFTDKDFFRDDKEHFYNCECHDGYAECTLIRMDGQPEEPHLKIKVVYPLLADILEDNAKVAAIREWRGLSDDVEITFGDIMVKYGEIEKRQVYCLEDLFYWFDVDTIHIEPFELEYNGMLITHITMDDNDRISYCHGTSAIYDRPFSSIFDNEILDCF